MYSNVCNLRRSGSADLLVKQLQRLCDDDKSRCTSWCDRECDGHQKEKKTTASTILGKVVFKYLACSRGFSFQFINQYAAKGLTTVFLSNKQQSPT